MATEKKDKKQDKQIAQLKKQVAKLKKQDKQIKRAIVEKKVRKSKRSKKPKTDWF